MRMWNPWHGCRKISEGCAHCYMFQRDACYEKDSRRVRQTQAFNEPVKKKRDGNYKVPGGTILYTCLTSDFWVEEADPWRLEAWQMIQQRQDVHFYIITKRIGRFEVGLPSDWDEGYPNVTVAVTCENQQRADERIPLLLSAPIRHREVIHEPMLGAVEIGIYLQSGKIEHVTCGGESGPGARLCDYDWILQAREQCISCQVPFTFKQTGALFRKGGRIYRIPRIFQMPQAQKANINTKN